MMPSPGTRRRLHAYHTHGCLLANPFLEILHGDRRRSRRTARRARPSPAAAGRVSAYAISRRIGGSVTTRSAVALRYSLQSGATRGQGAERPRGKWTTQGVGEDGGRLLTAGGIRLNSTQAIRVRVVTHLRRPPQRREACRLLHNSLPNPGRPGPPGVPNRGESSAHCRQSYRLCPGWRLLSWSL